MEIDAAYCKTYLRQSNALRLSHFWLVIVVLCRSALADSDSSESYDHEHAERSIVFWSIPPAYNILYKVGGAYSIIYYI